MLAMHSRWFVLALLLAVGLGGGVACGPRSNSGLIREGRDKNLAAEQLKGTWVFVDFEPEVGLEPMLASLLDAQRNALRVTFDGQTVTTEGPGINTSRSYEVVQSLFGRVDIVIFGDDGTTYEMIGQFIGDDLQFECRTAPWRGKGRLRRL
jgi:hypothetical protein